MPCNTCMNISATRTGCLPSERTEMMLPTICVTYSSTSLPQHLQVLGSSHVQVLSSFPLLWTRSAVDTIGAVCQLHKRGSGLLEDPRLSPYANLDMDEKNSSLDADDHGVIMARRGSRVACSSNHTTRACSSNHTTHPTSPW